MASRTHDALARASRRTTHGHSAAFARSHSHTRTTRQPAFRKVRFTSRSRACRRQPVIPCARNSAIMRSSVAMFPRPRIAAITALRFALVKTSLLPIPTAIPAAFFGMHPC